MLFTDWCNKVNPHRTTAIPNRRRLAGLTLLMALCTGLGAAPAFAQLTLPAPGNVTFQQGTGTSYGPLPAATGGTPPYVYSITPSLPEGLYFDEEPRGGRTISGAPALPQEPTIYTYRVVDNEGSSASATFSIEVTARARISGDLGGEVTEDDPVSAIRGQVTVHGLSSTALASRATTGIYGLFHLGRSGHWTYELENDDHDTNGLATGDVVTDTFTIMAAGDSSVRVNVVIRIHGNTDPEHTQLTLPKPHNLYFEQGQEVNGIPLPVAAGGISPYSYSLRPALPQGLFFGGGHNGSRRIYGLAEAPLEQTTYTYTVVDDDDNTASSTFTIEVFPSGPAIGGRLWGYRLQEDSATSTTSGELSVYGMQNTDFVPQTTRGIYGTFTLAASGRWVYELDNNDPDTDALATGNRVEDTFVVLAAGDSSVGAELRITIEGHTDPGVSCSLCLPQPENLILELLGSYNVGPLPSASGGLPPYSYSITPGLPAELTFTHPRIWGTPTALQPPTTYTYRVVDRRGNTASRTFTIEVVAARPRITGQLRSAVFEDDPTSSITASVQVDGLSNTELVPQVSRGTYGTFTMDDGGAWIYALDNDDPDTAALNDTDVVTDSFTVVAAGDSSVTARVVISIFGNTDPETPGVALSKPDDLTLMQGDDYVIGPLPGASGGAAPYTYSIIPLLPGGLGFYGWFNDDRTIRGTPDLPLERTTFTYQATDSEGNTATQTFTLEIEAAPPSIRGNLQGRVTEGHELFPSTNGAALVYGIANTDLVPQTTRGIYGTFTLLTSGYWFYDLDNDDPDTMALSYPELVRDFFVIEAAGDRTIRATVIITVGGTGAPTPNSNEPENDDPVTVNMDAPILDGVVNIATKRRGFTIGGTTESGASVSVTLGSGNPRTATVTETSWTLNVPPNAAEITGTSVSVVATASISGKPDGRVRSTLNVDLVAPTATWTVPASLTVGEQITGIAPGNAAEDTTGYALRSGALPVGLVLNQNDGVIRGTPTTASSNTATVSIRLTDRNANTNDVSITFPQVTRGTQSLNGFAYTPATVRLDQEPPALTTPRVTPPPGGALSYASTSTEVCTVNSGTGALTLVSAGICTITVTAAPTSGRNGATDTTTVTVNPSPSLTSASAIELPENTPPGNHIGAPLTPVHFPSGNDQWSITAGNDDGRFAIDESTGQLSLVQALDFETQPTRYTLTVQLARRDATATAQVAISVTDVDESAVAVILDANIAGDNVINIAEKAAGFDITGTTENGASVSLMLGSSGTPRDIGETGTAWRISIPADDDEITGTSLTVTATATAEGRTDGTVSRTVTVDLMVPTATYIAPETLTVGEAVIAMIPQEPSEDVVSYVLEGGALPAGLTLEPTTGAISGTPSVADPNPAVATIRLTDTSGNPGDVEITFPVVARAEQTLVGFAYATADIVQLDQTAPVLIPPTVTPVLVTSGSSLAYTSGDPEVCTVVSDTGALTLVGVGECAITVTAMETANYNAASVTFVIIVQAPPDSGDDSGTGTGTAPDAPPNGVGNLRATATVDTVTLGWTSPTGPTPAGYRIERAEGAGASVALADIADGSVTSFTDRGLTPNVRYTYSVTPFNDQGTGTVATITTTTGVPDALNVGADARLVVGFTLTRSVVDASLPLLAESSAAEIASIAVSDSVLHVAGVGTGVATITVTDALGASGSFLVSVVQPPTSIEIDGATSTGEPTDVSFSGGVSTDGGESYAEDGRVDVGDEIEIVFTISPEPEHVGAEAYLLVVVQNAETGAFSAISRNGVLVPITPEQLARGEEAFAERVLSASEVINALGGRFMLESIYRGIKVNMFVGYSLKTAPDAIYFTPVPFPLAVR